LKDFVKDENKKEYYETLDLFITFYNNNNLTGFDYILAFEIVKKLKEQKNLSTREIAFGKKVLDYIQDNPAIVEEIKSLSTLLELDIVEVKFIYDKLLLLSKKDWNKIIDIATQTSIFTQIELANVKSVQTLIFKKEIIKEQALIKCFDSLKKLKRFGIDII
jgi:hypothetical protein